MSCHKLFKIAGPDASTKKLGQIYPQKKKNLHTLKKTKEHRLRTPNRKTNFSRSILGSSIAPYGTGR